MIIDYHAHLGFDRKTQTFLIPELLEDMVKNQIDMRVVSALYGPSIHCQNEAIEQLVLQYPGMIFGSAVINPKAVDCLEELTWVINSKRFLSIELDPMEHNYFPEECEALDEILARASQAGLIINIYTGWGCRTMPAQWEKYALRHQEARFVLLHMGTTDFGYGTISLVSRVKNFYVETSCLYELPILRKAFKTIPPDRFLFGSHYPHKITKCSIMTFDMLDLDASTRKALFSDNALQWINKGKYDDQC